MGAHEIVAAAIIRAVRVLVSVDLNNKPFFAASKVCKKGADGELTRKAVAAKLARL